jgi:L,D-peptidoglycan transpeptidase YkuD (ErfK/YbiS/YcfS/YnhG family)
VSFGKNGLGWGMGLHGQALEDGPVVVEGSRRSPVGAFALNLAFGCESPELLCCKIDYIKLKPTHFAPDDVQHSKYYNRIVDTAEIVRDWDSAENMYDYMLQGVYAYGVVIEHNYDNPIPGKGSNFFIHVHRKPGAPTWGCTAFDQESVKNVVKWLDRAKYPVLVQLPKNIFEKYKNQWMLPIF